MFSKRLTFCKCKSDQQPSPVTTFTSYSKAVKQITVLSCLALIIRHSS